MSSVQLQTRQILYGGVDTTLAKVNSLESSVNLLKQDLTKIQNAVGKNVSIGDLKVKMIASYSGGNSSFVQVSGKGKLYLATLFCMYEDNGSAADVYIDGVKTFSFKGKSGSYYGTTYGGFYSAPVFKGASIMGDVNSNATWIMSTTVGSFIVTNFVPMNEGEFVYYEGKPDFRNKIFMSESPIVFNKSLEVQITKGSSFGIAVAYTLG